VSQIAAASAAEAPPREAPGKGAAGLGRAKGPVPCRDDRLSRRVAKDGQGVFKRIDAEILDLSTLRRCLLQRWEITCRPPQQRGNRSSNE
jgi:hypothetical protein